MQKSKLERDKLHRSTKKLIYSPQLSAVSYIAIQRLAWSLNKPMTEAINQLINALPAIIDPAKICLTCKNREDCKGCIFCNPLTAEEKTAILAAL